MCLVVSLWSTVFGTTVNLFGAPVLVCVIGTVLAVLIKVSVRAFSRARYFFIGGIHVPSSS